MKGKTTRRRSQQHRLSAVANLAEVLERRTLLDATVYADWARLTDRGVLQLDGTSSDDKIVVTASKSWINIVRANRGMLIPSENVLRIRARLGEGNDRFDSDAALPTVVFGGAGDDTILTGNGNDRIFGGRGDDQISTFDGSDTVRGGQGADLVDADGGNDLIFGGAGRDSLNGGAGDDTLQGESGDDHVVAESSVFDLHSWTGPKRADHILPPESTIPELLLWETAPPRPVSRTFTETYTPITLRQWPEYTDTLIGAHLLPGWETIGTIGTLLPWRPEVPPVSTTGNVFLNGSAGGSSTTVWCFGSSGGGASLTREISIGPGASLSISVDKISESDPSWIQDVWNAYQANGGTGTLRYQRTQTAEDGTQTVAGTYDLTIDGGYFVITGVAAEAAA